MGREKQGRQLVLWSRLAGSQKAGNGILRWTYQSAVSPWQGDIYLDFPPLLFAQTHLSYLFILLHPLPVKSQLENLTGESCNIVFHCSSFVCSLKCAQIEQGTNVIEWNAIIANKWKSANPLLTILNLASKEKQQNNFSRIKVCFHCVFFFIVFSFSLCFPFLCWRIWQCCSVFQKCDVMFLCFSMHALTKLI